MLIFQKDSKYYIFIHIPKNGGKSIRDKYINDKNNKIIKSYWHIEAGLDLAHIPYILKDKYTENSIEYNYFAYVRNPYYRVISAYFYKWPKQDKSALKKFIKQELILYDFSSMAFQSNIVHFYPQHLFVSDKNLNIPTNIKISKLDEIKHYNLGDFFDNKCIAIINAIYSKDFQLFNYGIINGQQSFDFYRIYTFINPTKTGGAALEQYFSNHYIEYIRGIDHYNKCTPYNNPIFVLREPVERFISMYTYWKYGSEINQRTKEFTEKYGSYTIKDFIKLIQKKALDDLVIDFTELVHFLPTCHWINRTPLDKIIIIKYEKNLDKKISNILHELGIPDKKIELPLVNISNSPPEKITLDLDDTKFIRMHYKQDFDLYEKAHTQANLFKKVI